MTDIYKTILEDTLAGYWDWNIPDNTEYLSPTFKSMFGYEDHELENKPETWQQLIFPEDLEKVYANYEQHVTTKGKIPYKNEVRYRHKSGHTVWVLCTGRVIEWDGDNPVRMIGCHIDITKQKKAEERLLDTQRFLTKTSEAARIGAWEVDLVKEKIEWSPVTRQIHEVDKNYTPDLESALNFYKKGDSRNRILSAFEKLTSEGKAYDHELLLVTAKGNEVWVRAIGNAEMKDGKCIKAYGTFQDINLRKRAEEQLKESEHRFREAFENSAIGMALVAPDGKWLKVNKQICEITGYTEQELLSKTFQDITHPEDLNLDLDNVQSLLEGKIENYQMEKRYFHKYGHTVWVLLSVSLIRSEDGTPVHFISQIEDITQRKTAEEQLNKVYTELTSLFESLTQVSVISSDYNGIIKHFSKGAETLLGYTAEEMIDKQTPAIIHVEEEVVARGKELTKELGRDIQGFEVFVAYAKEGSYESREWTYVRKDGSSFPVQLVVTAIRDASGKISGFLGIATDISQIKEAEEQLKKTIDIVSEQNTRLFNFAHIVSHNLRSHTGNLSLLLQLYQQTPEEEEKAELFSHLQSVSENLNETIQHLNEVVSIQTNINQQRKEIDLEAYIDKTIETLSGDISHTGTIINKEIPKGTTIKYNEAYLESILLNFLSNGIKYRSRDRQPIIGIAYKNNTLIISDNGKGIDMERHGKKLFGMYKTFHGNDDAKGIGLFITKNQVEALGGRIEVESEPDKGTTFKIFLNGKN